MATSKKKPAVAKKKKPRKESLRSMMEGEAANERNAASIAHSVQRERAAAAAKRK